MTVRKNVRRLTLVSGAGLALAVASVAGLASASSTMGGTMGATGSLVNNADPLGDVEVTVGDIGLGTINIIDNDVTQFSPPSGFQNPYLCAVTLDHADNITVSGGQENCEVGEGGSAQSGEIDVSGTEQGQTWELAISDASNDEELTSNNGGSASSSSFVNLNSDSEGPTVPFSLNLNEYATEYTNDKTLKVGGGYIVPEGLGDNADLNANLNVVVTFTFN